MLILEPDGRVVRYPLPHRSRWTAIKAMFHRWWRLTIA
jgi:hypothetical protein